jgi:hypothetical protein
MQIGSFTGSFDWIEQPPARCDLTFSQLCDLMRLLLAGQPIPIYTDPADLLSDLAPGRSCTPPTSGSPSEPPTSVQRSKESAHEPAGCG